VAVIELVKYRCRDTLTALRVLLSMAMKGEIRGLALCYRTEDGAEHTVFTGAYEVNQGNAVNAAMRLSVALTMAQDSVSGPP
jgi:hypothetical protein